MENYMGFYNPNSNEIVQWQQIECIDEQHTNIFEALFTSQRNLGRELTAFYVKSFPSSY